MTISLYDRASEAARYIVAKAKTRTPRVAVVLGSGLGGVADAVEDGIEIPYGESHTSLRRPFKDTRES